MAPAEEVEAHPLSPGPESRKSLQTVSRGLPAPKSKKCPKQSRNSLRSLKTVYLETPETVSRLFRTLFANGPRKDCLETLSGFRARRAQETPLRGGWGCNSLVQAAFFHHVSTHMQKHITRVLYGITPLKARMAILLTWYFQLIFDICDLLGDVKYSLQLIWW